MPSFAQRIRLLVLLALLAALLPAAQPVFAQTFTVNSTADTAGLDCSSTCTLRSAIQLANANNGPDTITFNIPGVGPHRITPLSPLDPLSDTTGGTTIVVSVPRTVVLDGSFMPGNGFGIQITSANNVVRGLVIVGFKGTSAANGGSGISLSTVAATNNVIADNWIGLDVDGTALGNAFYGVQLDEEANNNIIGGMTASDGNVITGNLRANVALDDSDTFTTGTVFISGNQILGNLIGISADGTQVPASVVQTNLFAGVFVGAYAHNTSIKGNRIGGHLGNGIIQTAGIVIESPSASALLLESHPNNTIIQANDIGVTATGTKIENLYGIRLSVAALNTTIGDPADPVAGRNVIGFSKDVGIYITDNIFNVTGTRIVGNYIGLARDGTTLATIGTVLMSDYQNAAIYLGKVVIDSPVTIGPANVIASARRFGIRVRSNGNVIKGNFIGTNAAGSTTSPTSATVDNDKGYSFGDSGIWLEHGTGNQIGGPNGGDRNVIAAGSGSVTGAFAAIVLMPGGGDMGGCGSFTCNVTATTIQGNYLGVRATGDAKLDPSISAVSEGVRITDNDSPGSITVPSSMNIVRGNVISGLAYGVAIYRGANGNTIDANRIGTRASGNLILSQAIRNQREGIKILQGTNNTISNNIIAYNGDETPLPYHGILLDNATGTANTNMITGNTLVANGDFAGSNGIYINGPSGILISKTTTSNHKLDGIKLVPGSNGDMVAPTLTGVSGPVSAAFLAGTATCLSGNCTLEVFTSHVSEDKEGPVYLTTAPVVNGAFSVDITGCMDYLTATLRDNTNNNTSAFSSVFNSIPTAPDSCGDSTFILNEATPTNAYYADVGTSYTYSHSILNGAPIARTFTVVITSTMGWASAPPMVTVPAGGSASFDVVVSVPYTADSTAPTDVDVTNVQVFVGTRGSNVVTDTTTVKDNTPTPATATVSAGYTQARGGDTTTFTHTVTNIGAASGGFSVTGPSGTGLPTFIGTPPTGWTIQSATLTQTTLAGGASTNLVIVVNTPAGAPAASVQFNFIVKVDNGTQTNPATIDTITVPAVRTFTFTAVAPTTKTSPPGAPISFTYTLVNTGNASDDFQITPPTNTTPVATPLPITVFTVDPPGSFTLAAGASRTVTLTAQIPSGTNVADYEFTVGAATVGGVDPPAAQSATGTISVTGGGAPFFVGSASVSPDPVDAGNQVTIVHTVRNSGNQAVPFTFGVASLPSGWTLDSQSSTCPTPVPTGASTCTVTTVVNVPLAADGGNYSVGVSATADNGTAGASADDVTVTDTVTVRVTIVRGVSLSAATPSATQTGGPGTVLTYNHTLTNVGNTTDSFTLSFVPTPPATVGMAVLSPLNLTNVLRNETRTVTLQVTIPGGMPAGDLDFVITATSDGDATKTATRTDRATISLIDAASISAGTTQGGAPGAVVTFNHTLTNTGSTTIAYDISATNSHVDFVAPTVTPATTAVLAPGATATVTIQVTLPTTVPGGTSNTTTIEVRAAGGGPILASTTDVSFVGDTYDVEITPDLTGTGYPGRILVFTHNVRNTGVTADSYNLTAVNSLGWPISIVPNALTLAPGADQDVTVSISVPNDLSTFVGAVNFARIRVVSQTHPTTVNDEATEEITIGKVIDLVMSADQPWLVTPQSGTLRMRDLVLTNNGNGSDIVDFTVTGADNGWEVILDSLNVIGAHDTDYNIGIRVRVPTNVTPDVVKVITIQARSRFDPTEFVEVRLRFLYIAPPTVITYRTYLPIVILN